MENSLLQRKYPFTKWVADNCRILAGWKNHYGDKDTRTTKANDSMAFMTIRNEGKRAMKRKKLHVTNAEKLDTNPTSLMRWNCEDIQHSNFVVLNKDTDDSSSEEEHIGTDSTETIRTELKIVDEEEEYDLSTDTDEENEKEPDEDTDEYDGCITTMR